MIWKLLIVVFLGVTLTSVSWLQGSGSSDRGLKNLVKDSKVIAIGTLESTTTVVRPEAGAKLDKESRTVILPDPKDYTAGRIYRIKITSILKGTYSGEQGAKDSLDVFVPGIFQLHSKPIIVEDKEYVFFLEQLTDETKAYANTVVFQPDGGQIPFVPDAYYSALQNGEGVIELKKNQGDLVLKIKAFLD